MLTDTNITDAIHKVSFEVVLSLKRILNCEAFVAKTAPSLKKKATTHDILINI